MISTVCPWNLLKWRGSPMIFRTVPRLAIIAAAVSLPSLAQSLPEGPGKEVLGQVCTECHDLERVTSQHRSSAGWQATIDRMMTMGASAKADEVNAIVDYLAKNFGETPAPPVAAAAALPMPVFHHIHINSVDPERSLAWYAKYWPTGTRTTIAGFPA